MANMMYRPQPYFGCLKCKAELNRRVGQWVKRWQDREISGYWISALMCPWISAKQILEKKKGYTDEQFANFVLGQPYIGKGNVLTRQAFTQNLTPKVNPQTSRPIIGVDTGVAINYVIGNSQGLFYYDKCEDYGPINNFLSRNPTAIAVIDQGGDIIGPRKLREKYPNRVFLCFFSQDRKNDELIRWNDEDGTVVADRNKMLQMVVDEFTEKRIPVSGTETEWHDYMTEWLGMYRTSEENALGIPVFIWNKPASGRCDYPFSTVYWRIGIDRFLQESATFHEPRNDSFASLGLEVNPDNTAFLPRNR